MTTPLLSIDSLSIAFRQQQTLHTVVSDLSLRIEAGETLALVGESGSGKSVSALSILRLLPSPPVVYPGGDILFHGESLLHASERTLRGVRGNTIAMIFQEPMVSLNPLHTLEKQLYEVLSLHRGTRREAARAEILDCLDRVGIRNARQRLGDFPHQFSGGERQRVMIAMALLTRPELLIADEPTTALDVTVQAQILRLLRDQARAQQMALMLITHDLGVIAQMAEHVVVMYAGRIVEQGPTADVLRNPLHPYTKGLIASRPVPGERRRRLYSIPGQVPDLAELPPYCAFYDRCERATAQCRAGIPPLIGQTRQAACIHSELAEPIA
jgi:oligopeptide/dipeptide ABC transporter, ATP-binding protein, C-terminal domain